MFHSIRWRLIVSFTLVTLLTVTLLGVMVLSLMQRTLEREASAYLTANAQAVARQSQILFQPAPQTAELYQLAHTAAFLGDAQVRILDDQKQVLVDSGSPLATEEVTWIVQATGWGEAIPAASAAPVTAPALAPALIVMGSVTGDTPPGSAGLRVAGKPPAQAIEGAPVEMITVRKLPGPWGDRLLFHTVNAAGTVIGIQPLTTTLEAAVPVTDIPFELAQLPLQATAPIQAGPEVVGYVELSSMPNFVAATLRVIRQAFLIAAGVVTLVSVGVGLVVSRGLTAPLDGLAAATGRMNSGDLSARAPVHGNDEIGLLARQFNQMAAALENSFAALAAERDALRRFIADASHELRTPITALRTFHELLLGEAASDAHAQREFLLEGQTQIDRLERITGHLLNLSRLDGGLVQLVLAEHDLAEFVTGVVTPLRALAQERQIDVRLDLPAQPHLLYGDRSQLETALINFLDNALKFTPAGGQVQIGAAGDASGVELWVKDNGPGIPADELPHVFERFYRGHQTTGAGSGLGLAIVLSIVHAHQGTVHVVSQVGVGSRFVIHLPAKA
jgi:signal transduction histidine kinase